MDKFCFILTTVEGYGADKSIINLIIKLKEKNFIVEVIAREEGRSTRILRDNKIKTIIWPFFINVSFLKIHPSRNFYITVKKNLASFLNWISALIFSFKYKNSKYKVIHTNTIVTDFGYQLSRQFKSIDAWHLREIPEAFDIYFPKKHLKANNLRIFYSNSVFVHNYYLNNYNISSFIVDNIFLSKPSKFYNKKKSSKKFKFCFIGRLSKDKDPITVAKAFVRAFSNLSSENSKPVLEIYGEGDLRSDIISIFKKSNMEDQLFLYGYRSNIIDLINNIDVGICASKLEAFGRVTVEYMLASKLVIASDSGNHQFLIKNKETGLLFPYKNVVKLSELMYLAFNDSMIYKKLSTQGFYWSREKFKLENSIKDFLDPIIYHVD